MEICTRADHTRSCKPRRQNQTLLAIGQDLFSIQEYVTEQFNASLHSSTKSTTPMHAFFPAAAMFYTDIQSLRGMESPVDYGSGIEYAPGLAAAYSSSGIQVGLWLNGTDGCMDIVAGNLDGNIRQMYQNISAWNTPKVFLRVGYEFDNPYFGYSTDPSIYQEAFRRLVRACCKELGHSRCHDRVAFVWHSWAAPRWVDDLGDFYPGSEFVDWVGISIFQQLYPWASAGGNFAGGSINHVEEVLDFAKARNKPVMIAESTPFGGVFWDGRSFGPNSQHIDLSSSSHDLPNNIWDLWFVPVLNLIEQHGIQMWSYINCDWDSQPMWQTIGFGDSRISKVDSLMTKWRSNVLENPRFIMGPLRCHGDNDKSFHKTRMPADHLRAATLTWLEGEEASTVGPSISGRSPEFAIFGAALCVGIFFVAMTRVIVGRKYWEWIKTSCDAEEEILYPQWVRETQVPSYGTLNQDE